MQLRQSIVFVKSNMKGGMTCKKEMLKFQWHQNLKLYKVKARVHLKLTSRQMSEQQVFEWNYSKKPIRFCATFYTEQNGSSLVLEDRQKEWASWSLQTGSLFLLSFDSELKKDNGQTNTAQE